MIQFLFNYLVDDLHTTTVGTAVYFYSVTPEEIAAFVPPELPEEAQNLRSASFTARFREKYSAYAAQREAALTLDWQAGHAVRYYQDMAVLTWDSFYTDLDFWDNYQVGDPITSQDTPGFLFRTFADIQANHPEVKRIVLDLTHNTGGSYSSVLTTMGFMKHQFRMTWNYAITDVELNTDYSLDTNLDSRIDESDSLEGKYDFYILQSSASFSAANELAYFAKKMNAATIVGEPSGGGAAAVAMTMDFYGLAYNYSSTTSYGIDESHLRDVIVEPDLPLSSDAWYDDAALWTALSGETPPDDTSYTVTVTDGTLEDGTVSGEFHEGDTVTVTAGQPSAGQKFQKWTWTSDTPLEFVNGGETASTASFLMPAGNVEIGAVYQHSQQSQPRSQGCYIATAVYGSYDCPEVWTLRRFRDETLSRSWYGRLFIRFYYALSPTAVRLFGDTEWFQNFWRTRLDNMVTRLQSDGVSSVPYDDPVW